MNDNYKQEQCKEQHDRSTCIGCIMQMVGETLDENGVQVSLAIPSLILAALVLADSIGIPLDVIERHFNKQLDRIKAETKPAIN